MTSQTIAQIIVIDDAGSEYWHKSAIRTVEFIRQKATEMGVTGRVSLELLHPEEATSKLSEGRGTSSLCLICHLQESTFALVEALMGRCCWIFVSGGRSLLPERLEARLRDEPVIWFQGAYGRESRFGLWLSTWCHADFAIDQFSAASATLHSGISGVAKDCQYLMHDINGLRLLFSAYMLIPSLTDNAGGDAKKSQVYKAEISAEWLSNELAKSADVLLRIGFWANDLQGTLRKGVLELDKDASKDIQTLLGYFVAMPDFHAVGTSEFEDDIAAIISSRLEGRTIDSLVEKWLKRISDLDDMVDTLIYSEPAKE